MNLLKRNQKLQDMNLELEREIKKYEQDSYFREDSDFSSAFSDDSALDLDDDDDDDEDEDEDEDEENNSNESDSTQGHESNERTGRRPEQVRQETQQSSENQAS